MIKGDAAATRGANLTVTVRRRRFFASYEFVSPSLYFCHVARLSCPGDEGQPLICEGNKSHQTSVKRTQHTNVECFTAFDRKTSFSEFGCHFIRFVKEKATFIYNSMIRDRK